MKSSSRRAGPRLSVAWCLFLLFRPHGFVISFVINTGYTIYFTICSFMCET
jgi:hypothetical protein